MASQVDVLNEIAKKLNALRKEICCKLDLVVEASGGSTSLYNIPRSAVVLAGDVYNSPECHAIEISVVGSLGDVAVLTINGSSANYPAGYSFTLTASTVFESGMFVVESSSTATVIVNTLTTS